MLDAERMVDLVGRQGGDLDAFGHSAFGSREAELAAAVLQDRDVLLVCLLDPVLHVASPGFRNADSRSGRGRRGSYHPQAQSEPQPAGELRSGEESHFPERGHL